MSYRRSLGLAVLVFLTTLIICSNLFSTNAQGAQSQIFAGSTQFQIPANNATINFAGEGSYQTASLNDGTWDFSGLQCSLSAPASAFLPGAQNFNFSVSAWNSNITITCLNVLNGFPPADGWLNYTVAGKGFQAFNMYYGNNAGLVIYWTVYMDGVNKSQNDSWAFSSDGWLSVTGASQSVDVYRENVDPWTAKANELRAEGMNDTQIEEALAKLNMWWDPTTGAGGVGTLGNGDGSPSPTTAPMLPFSSLSVSPSTSPVLNMRFPLASTINARFPLWIVLAVVTVVTVIAVYLSTRNFHKRVNERAS